MIKRLFLTFALLIAPGLTFAGGLGQRGFGGIGTPGFLASAGGVPPPPPVCSQATTYLARTTGGNEGGNSLNITTLICGLVTDGVITGDLSAAKCGTGSFDTLYIFAQQNQADSLLNLCSSSFTLGITGGITFTSYVGWSGFFTAGGRLNTNFNSTTATSPNFTQNSASIGFWTVATVIEGIGQMGNGNTGVTGETNIFGAYTGSLFYARVTNGTIGSVPLPGTKGLFVAERPSSTNVIPYWDGIAQATQTGASQTPLNAIIYIGATTLSASPTKQQLAEAHIGASLGATLNLALYNRLRTYMSAVGVP